MTSRNCHPIIDYSGPISAAASLFCRLILVLLLFSSAQVLAIAATAKKDPLVFDDTPLKEPLPLPSWFKLSFLDLREDMAEAREDNRGLIIYFGRHDCAYCKALLEKNWGRPDIRAYTQRYFDVMAIDVLGNRQITDLNGNEMSEKEYAALHKANFTPTLHIYDRKGKLAYKLIGYRPPYQFKAVLEYVADNHHEQEKFSSYFSRAEMAESFGHDRLNKDPAFKSGKNISLHKSKKPVLVLFEAPNCHACDVLHSGPLQNKTIKDLLKYFNAVQLDSTKAQAVVTPSGKTTTSKAWADELYLDYTPTLMFFDEQGREIVRIDSVVWFYRLRNVLDYVLDKGYLKYPTFQQWRSKSPNY